MAQETLIQDLNIPDSNIFAYDTSLATPTLSAKAYEQAIIKHFGLSNHELPVFDLVLLGIGEDGHTASIFPQSPLLDLEPSSTQIVAAVENPENSQDRLTLTPNAILKSERIYFMVKGQGKAEVLEEVFTGSKSSHEVPVKLFSKAEAQITWFLDSAAASKLPR
jgi:6-phosphogluconolactonase